MSPLFDQCEGSHGLPEQIRVFRTCLIKIGVVYAHSELVVGLEDDDMVGKLLQVLYHMDEARGEETIDFWWIQSCHSTYYFRPSA